MADESTLLERVQELTWALVDEQISDDEMSLLDNLLLSDEAARFRYLECVQLHADLFTHYAAPLSASQEKSTSKSPVLGFLNSGNPPMGYELPRAEDPKP
jgi:hypothetical protein